MTMYINKEEDGKILLIMNEMTIMVKSTKTYMEMERALQYQL